MCNFVYNNTNIVKVQKKNFLTEVFPILDHKKINFPETQTKILMERFQANQFLTIEEKRELALSFNVTKERITYWFKYMRRKRGAKKRLSQGQCCSVMHYDVQIINYFCKQAHTQKYFICTVQWSLSIKCQQIGKKRSCFHVLFVIRAQCWPSISLPQDSNQKHFACNTITAMKYFSQVLNLAPLLDLLSQLWHY